VCRGEDDRAGQGHVHQDLHQRDAAEFDDIAQNETHSQCDNPDLQPEFVRLDAGVEDAVQADGVGDDKADDDRRQHILDVGHCPMIMVRKRIPPHLRVLAEQADRDQQQDTRHIRQQVTAGETRLPGRIRLINNYGAHHVTTESWAAAQPRPTAPQSRPRSWPTNQRLSVRGVHPSLVRHRHRSRSPQSP
jgi:hypothetical protein